MFTSNGSHEVEDFRCDVKEFLEENLPSDWTGVGALEGDEFESFIHEWRERLVDRGYLAPAWPKEYGGGGASSVEAAVVAEEFALVGAPTGAHNDEIGISLLGNTLLRWGSEEQRAHYLPRIIAGVDRWCQGYSEPNAGSDLASLACRAELDGDEWVVNGQKIWTSHGLTANWIFLLARTGSGGSKHEGITFLLCPIDQPGVEVRPIRMMSGGTEFCETFFTDARLPRDCVVGDVGKGWKVAMTLLANERGSSAVHTPIIFRTELDRLVELAKDLGVNGDPVIRQGLAASHARVEILRYLGLRTITALARGQELGPDASVFKLCWSEHHREITELAVSILGANALVPTGRKPSTTIRTDDPGAPNSSASWTNVLYNARAGTIYAGTSEIQRNILGEMILGLPKEPRVEAKG